MHTKISLTELISHENKVPFEGTLIALDPGQTTGYAVFHGSLLKEAGQLDTKTIENGLQSLENLLLKHRPNFVVFENYRVYQHKAQDHANSELHTSQFIGCIKVLCLQKAIPCHNQMASVAKQFCTDDKLKAWGCWIKGQKHARDAIRHGIYFLLFNWRKHT